MRLFLSEHIFWVWIYVCSIIIIIIYILINNNKNLRSERFINACYFKLLLFFLQCFIKKNKTTFNHQINSWCIKSTPIWHISNWISFFTLKYIILLQQNVFQRLFHIKVATGTVIHRQNHNSTFRAQEPNSHTSTTHKVRWSIWAVRGALTAVRHIKALISHI